jgi:4-diphosphocytidyl-2-C-methyl-D-erythritol kinase
MVEPLAALRIDPIPGGIRVRAPGKINLFLEVRGRRPDGYHEIETVMAPVSLADDLLCRRSRELRVRGDLADLGEENLVVRAVRAAQNYCGTRRGMDATLKKRIPVGAGLGGGSADAAAAIAAFDRVHRLGLNPEDLSKIGASVGSDIPFFFCGTAALCTGRGEIVQPVRVAKRLHLALFYPGFPSPTARVYRLLKLGLTRSRVDVKSFLKLLAEGSIDGLGRALFNRLEEPAFRNLPRLRALKRALSRLGFRGVLMSGSGSSLFGLCRSREEARAGARRMSAAFPSGRAFVVCSV